MLRHLFVSLKSSGHDPVEYVASNGHNVNLLRDYIVGYANGTCCGTSIFFRLADECRAAVSQMGELAGTRSQPVAHAAHAAIVSSAAGTSGNGKLSREPRRFSVRALFSRRKNS